LLTIFSDQIYNSRRYHYNDKAVHYPKKYWEYAKIQKQNVFTTATHAYTYIHTHIRKPEKRNRDLINWLIAGLQLGLCWL